MKKAFPAFTAAGGRVVWLLPHDGIGGAPAGTLPAGERQLPLERQLDTVKIYERPPHEVELGIFRHQRRRHGFRAVIYVHICQVFRVAYDLDLRADV